ncbi:peptidoglycan-binding protein [Streptomyces hokutonensis]|uniref:peptidoglycan-binding protein n=1 Tax=Streptomyces hokutonensis TaxID=1306990 RepID=UPI003674F6B0
MSRWKHLPAELDPRVRQLVIRMRRLKDHGGLSIRQLAAKTGYSPKSWERYLSGRTLPPPEAVEALARIAGEADPTRLLALHEVAAEGWASPRHLAAEPGPGPDVELLSAGSAANSPAPPGRSLLIALIAGAVTLVLAVSSAVLITVRIMDDNNDGAPNAGGSATTSTAPLAAPATLTPAPPQLSYTCRPKRVDGLWYAGNSRTREDVVAYGNKGVEVAEAQCLLRRAGFSPGGIDGDFGPLTLGAVRALQQHAGLRVDGMVGPQTWKALRR